MAEKGWRGDSPTRARGTAAQVITGARCERRRVPTLPSSPGNERIGKRSVSDRFGKSYRRAQTMVGGGDSDRRLVQLGSGHALVTALRKSHPPKSI